MSDEFPVFPKIDSIFKRDEKGRFLLGQYATEELEFLRKAKWDWTEKVDGTNMRIYLCVDRGSVESDYNGRTDNAQIPVPLARVMQETINDWSFDLLSKTFLRDEDSNESLIAILYGEGYGAGIQKGGGYRPDPGFILFDVLIDNQWWMVREVVEEIGSKLGLDVVPKVGTFDLDYAVGMVSSDSFESAWPNVEMEGIVGVPRVPLFDRRHRRIMTKVKVRDFQ